MNFRDEDFQKSLCIQGADREPDGCDDDGCPYWICDCGHDTPEPYSFADGKVLLCCSCVHSAMNRYWHRRSGEYLTWTNPVRVDPYKRKGIPAKIRQQIFERDAYRCRYCGEHTNLVIEHVVPHIRTQDDSEENLVTACRKCNAKKKDRTPEEAGMVLLPIPTAEAA